MIERSSSFPAPQQTAADDLLPVPDLNMIWVNDRVLLREDSETGYRAISVSGVQIAYYYKGDKQSQRYIAVMLRIDGHATQLEISEAFGHHRVTQARWESEFLSKGMAGLNPYRPEGRPVSISSTIEEAVVRLHSEGLGMRRISDQLSLPINIVRGVYARRGLKRHIRGRQARLDEIEGYVDPGHEDGSSEKAAGVLAPAQEGPAPEQEWAEEPEDDGVEVPRKVEHWDGLLRPEYESAADVGFAGVLLALPIMRQLKVLEVLGSIYGSLGLLAFYGLECFVNVMVFLALWRIKRPEDLKGHQPEVLGRSVGLPRVPEVKTVRRKLALLAGQGKARQSMSALAKVRLEQEEDLLGYLYVDGHLRSYSGKADVAKGYSMLKHRPIRATTDTWANDRHGLPLFLVTSEINEGLTQTLEPVLKQARDLVGDDRVLTVIFDRGGWSPQLFARLIEAGFAIITYRKGTKSDLPETAFTEHAYDHGGKVVTYKLHDERSVQVGRDKVEWEDGTTSVLRMREITCLKTTGKQTRVVTTRDDLEPQQILWLMFARWRQENFFKYMRQEFAVDALVEYGWQSVDPSKDRPNPEHLAMKKQIDQLSAAIKDLQSQRCQLLGEISPEPEVIDGFERFDLRQHSARELLRDIRDLQRDLGKLKKQCDKVPDRISAGDLDRLKTERQQIATLFKMVAHNIETQLFHMVAPYFRKTEHEGRKLIAAALRSSADLEVTPTELRVTLAPQSSAHRSRAIADLCASLNNLDTTVPGTKLRLVLDCAVQDPPDVAL